VGEAAPVSQTEAEPNPAGEEVTPEPVAAEQSSPSDENNQQSDEL
jgi:hypothetical protein